MKKIAIYGFLLILASLQVACKDWLDVKPKTAVEEDVLFSTEQGFKENLTGIYLLLAVKIFMAESYLTGLRIFWRSAMSREEVPISPN